jgi:hypothetical protein
LVLAACAVWLVMQNMLLFVMLAWGPFAPLRVALMVLARDAVHAAAPLVVLPGHAALGVACVLPVLPVLGRLGARAFETKETRHD